MKLLVDMNLSPKWCDLLQSQGWGASHWFDIGDPGAPDESIMTWAREHDHIVLTHDLDFGAMLAAGAMHGPSVVQVRTPDVSPETMGAVLVEVLRDHEQVLRRGALITVEPRRNRVRILPIEK